MQFLNRYTRSTLAKIAAYAAIGLAPVAAGAKAQNASPPRPAFALAMAMEDDGDEMAMPPADPKPMVQKDAAPMECCGMTMGKPMGPGLADDKMGGMAKDKIGGMPGGPGGMKGSAAAGAQTAKAPHLLHVGAKDFFLDQARRINLTPEQKANLGKIKADAASAKATSQKGIDVAQQELWQLTSADPADAAAIDGKVQEIGKLTADQQMASIHSVAEAATVLDDQQRVAVVKPGAAGSMPKMPKSGSMKKSM